MWVYRSRDLRFIAVNDAAVAHYGYSREQFLASGRDSLVFLKNVAE